MSSRREQYDRLHHIAELRFPREDYRHFVEWLNIPRTSSHFTVLDIACGQGFFLEAARKMNPNLKVLGIDFSTAALQKAKTRSPDVVCASADCLPFPDSTFDYCTNLGSLEHFDNPLSGLREMFRVLKPTGKAMIIVPNRYYVGTLWRVLAYGEEDDQEQEGLTDFHTVSGWKELFLAANLDVTGVQPYNGVDHIAWYFKRKDGVITEFEKTTRQFLDTFIKPLIPLNLSQCFVFFLRRQPL
ncbi:MAG TPA: class I SAM-dependent methyltransferase [Candidatus Hydrogenedentes bacterium]|nr:class I SAM-dependent methyltransferase [Candidatus Hydrogenedentota bacterium]HOL77402.1 class I SAM-dependent methyltransferase [Candidatus Hydrogenedentota bacterium]HPO84546.1 class I SAM-dependent methyltransferase [Candidatus Hydrogenedentota bacterium]